MNIIKENTGKLTSVVKIQLENKDYQPNVDKALKKAAQNVAMPGFRKGKVPMSMVKKMYGANVLIDEINKLLSDTLNNYISENKLNLLGEPLPNADQQVIDWDNAQDVEFKFDIAEAPEMNFDLAKQKTTYYKIKVGEEQVKERLNGLARRFGSQINVDVVEGTDIIRCDLAQVDEAGNAVEGGYVKENAAILVSMVKNEAEADTFKGRKKGETFVFNPKSVFGNDAEVSSLLGVKREDEALMNSSYKATINEIQRNQPAEMNQEFFDQAFGEGVVKSEEEASNKIKGDIEKQFALNSDYKFFFDTKDSLVEGVKDVELPEEFLKRWLLAINKNSKDITPEEIEKEFPAFLTDLRWQIIKNKLVKDNEIKVTNEDVVNAAKEFTRMQLAQFGMMNPSDEDLNRWSGEILKNREEVNRIADSEIDKKIIAIFKSSVKSTEKEVSLEEFNKMFEK